MSALYGLLGGVLLALIAWWVYRVEQFMRPRSKPSADLVAAGNPPLSPVEFAKEKLRLREKITHRFGVKGAQADQAADEIARVLTQVPRGR